MWEWEDRQVHRGRKGSVDALGNSGRKTMFTYMHTHKHAQTCCLWSVVRLGKPVGVEAKETWREGAH